MPDRMKKFLMLVPAIGWRDVPPNWNSELREALGNGLVTVGWGGVIMLTGDGRKARGRYEQLTEGAKK